MGLKLRYNLFHNTSSAAVFGAYTSYYEGRGRPLQPTGDERRRVDFHEFDNGWTAVTLDSGWEWKERREAQLFVSRRLWCPGLLIFVYDGDYWGYELFDYGEAFDHFVQESQQPPIGFPNEDCRGQAEIVARHLPFLSSAEIAPYLVQKQDWVIPAETNVPARPGDEFRRFEECAVLDFLRMLGVRVERKGGIVRLASPVFRSAFKVVAP